MRKLYLFIFFVTVAACLFFLGYCFADNTQKSVVHAPEPSTTLLITTGVFGSIINFARRRFNQFKRASDIIVSFLGLVITSPIMAFTMLLIKIVSPGPVLFKQERVGRDGKIFTIYKLRTMRTDAEKFTGAVWAKEDDPRLIRYGKLIRKAHIDELPQLLNVLNGEMSMIGPRPERPEIVSYLKEAIRDYERRLAVKPGITGMAQVWHKYDETLQDVKKKIKYDILYIKKMCLMVDLQILAYTFIAVLTGRGAR